MYLSNNYHTDIKRRYEKTEWLIGMYVMHYDSIRVEVQEYVYKYGIENNSHKRPLRGLYARPLRGRIDHMFFANSRCPVFSFCPTLKLPNINLHYRFYGEIERLWLHTIALHNDISITSLNNISPFHGTYSNNDPKVY